MDIVYKYRNRRQAADAVTALVDTQGVADIGVFVAPDYVLIGVSTASDDPLVTERAKGILGLGTDVTRQFGALLGRRLNLEELGLIEVYLTPEGVKRFRGYSYRRKKGR